MLTADRVEELRCRAANGEKKTVLAREFGISRETVYQHLEHRDKDTIGGILPVRVIHKGDTH